MAKMKGFSGIQVGKDPNFPVPETLDWPKLRPDEYG